MATISNSRDKQRRLSAPDRIAVATDLGDTEYLVAHATDQARAGGAALTFIHAIPPAEAAPLDAAAIPYIDALEMEREAKRFLEGISARIRARGMACDAIVRHGRPSDIVPESVRDIGATRLILGTHGRRRLEKFLLGSVASQLLQTVDVPVYTVGPHARANLPRFPAQTILHPASLADGYERSAQTAIDLARFYQADLTLLHVVDRDLHREYESPRTMERTRAQLEKLIPSEVSPRIHVTAQIEVGETVQRILQVADETQAGLIVLGVSSENSFWSIQGDTTAYEIIAQAKCPVLTAKHSRSAARPEHKTGVLVPPGMAME